MIWVILFYNLKRFEKKEYFKVYKLYFDIVIGVCVLDLGIFLLIFK